jgi:uncharacterized protein DUF4149
MFALRCAALIALAVWVGGLIGIGLIGAPAIFDVVESRQLPGGRALAGAIFGAVLGRFHLVSYVCGAVVLGVLAARAVLGPRPRWFAIRAGIAATMLAAALYSGLIVSPAVARAQQEIGAAPSSLPEGDPRRAAFGRLHAQSSLLQLVPIAGGLALMLIELRD